MRAVDLNTGMCWEENWPIDSKRYWLHSIFTRFIVWLIFPKIQWIPGKKQKGWWWKQFIDKPKKAP